MQRISQDVQSVPDFVRSQAFSSRRDPDILYCMPDDHNDDDYYNHYYDNDQSVLVAVECLECMVTYMR